LSSHTDILYDGNAIGSYQEDKFQAHRHFRQSSSGSSDMIFANPQGTYIASTVGVWFSILYEAKTGIATNFDNEPMVRSGNETKPASISVLCCISY